MFVKDLLKEILIKRVVVKHATNLILLFYLPSRLFGLVLGRNVYLCGDLLALKQEITGLLKNQTLLLRSI